MRRFLPIIYILLIVSIFFWSFLFRALLPIPSDNIVGLYHPFQDFYRKTFTRGVPYKNYLLTDPVRQQYPWRELAISLEEKIELPLWNPYSFAGTPLLANFQSGTFYPFNLLFLAFPFSLGWSLLIMLQPLLAAFFMYLYLTSLKLNKWACVLGSTTFAFCGFFIAWLEWGTIVHTALWLPLILLAIDKIVLNIKSQVLSIKNKKIIAWIVVYIFSLTSSFFAGHLQVFLYVFLTSLAYILTRWFQFGRQKRIIYLFITLNSLFIILTSFQWYPTLQFVNLSARDIDQANWSQNPGWFIPWRHLIQFLAPDFFGNPATLNYWSIFNYGEFVGYVGIFPLIMAIVAILFRRDSKTLWFSLIFLISFVFSFPTFIASFPFILKIPFLSTSQPTRLMFLMDLGLVVLSALGFDYYIRNKKKIIIPLTILLFIFLALWVFVFIGDHLFSSISTLDLGISQRNLYVPSAIFISISLLAILDLVSKKKNIEKIVLIGFLVITALDLLRFGSKYTPFIAKDFLFPKTKTLAFLQEKAGLSRIMTSDSPVFPPNFSVIFRLQSVDGYDPLYLRNYAELVAAWERGKPDMSSPFGFNRIIIPHNFESRIADLLGVRYVLSRTDIESKKLIKVFQEGETRVYENPYAFSRVFFAQNIICAENRKQIVKQMFSDAIDLHKIAFVEDSGLCAELSDLSSDGKVKVLFYSENKIILETENRKKGFLVFVDSYYPTWHAKIYSNIDSIGKNTKIYLTNLNFRGIIVPSGKNIIEFYITLI